MGRDAAALVGERPQPAACCLVVDVRLPGLSGLDFQSELAKRNLHFPIVFITAHGDEALRPRVLEEGAVECLFKPFSDTALLGAIQAALQVE